MVKEETMINIEYKEKQNEEIYKIIKTEINKYATKNNIE